MEAGDENAIILSVGVNLHDWDPSEVEWDVLLQCIQPEERKRVSRFLRKIDQKRALLGRLLIRQIVVENGQISWTNLTLGRTEANKPIVTNTEDLGISTLSFNMSHHGNWVLAASHKLSPLGIDVMEYETPPSVKNISAFIDIMETSFAEQELNSLRKCMDEDHKLKLFYMFWCLKEAFIKATGDGLKFGLSRLDFRGLLPGLRPSDQQVQLLVDGEVQTDWYFSLGELDEKHCFAIGVRGLPTTQRETIKLQTLNISASEFVAPLLLDPPKLDA